MNRDIINLINSQIVKDYEDQIAYYKALANTYKAISDAKGRIGSRYAARYAAEYMELCLIDYVVSLDDGYNKKYSGVLDEIEEIVDNVIERWKYRGDYPDKVAKYERVMF